MMTLNALLCVLTFFSIAARVARQFYLEGVSKVDIADRLGISRFRVARLLDSARDAGMVRIEIGLPGGSLDAGLSAELCSAFGLRHAFVFNFPDDDEQALRRRLGEAAGQAVLVTVQAGGGCGIALGGPAHDLGAGEGIAGDADVVGGEAGAR